MNEQRLIKQLADSDDFRRLSSIGNGLREEQN
jgi:hypothetical protein